MKLGHFVFQSLFCECSLKEWNHLPVISERTAWYQLLPWKHGRRKTLFTILNTLINNNISNKKLKTLQIKGQPGPCCNSIEVQPSLVSFLGWVSTVWALGRAELSNPQLGCLPLKTSNLILCRGWWNQGELNVSEACWGFFWSGVALIITSLALVIHPSSVARVLMDCFLPCSFQDCITGAKGGKGALLLVLRKLKCLAIWWERVNNRQPFFLYSLCHWETVLDGCDASPGLGRC